MFLWSIVKIVSCIGVIFILLSAVFLRLNIIKVIFCAYQLEKNFRFKNKQEKWIPVINDYLKIFRERASKI